MFFILFIQQLIASTTHVVSKSIIGQIQPPTLLLIRAFIASLFFLSLIPVRKIKLIKIEKKDWFYIFLLGVLNVPLNQFLFFTSLKYTSAPNVALAYALSPAFVLIISFFFLNEKATLLKILGIGIAFAGTTFILFERGFDFSSQNFWGINLAIAASVYWAIYTILGKKFVNKYGAIYTNLLAMVIGFLLFIPIFFIVKAPYNYLEFSGIQWLQIMYLGIFTSGIAYILWYYALKKIDAAKVSVFNNIQPVLTTILAIIFLNQNLSMPFVLGGLMTIAGVIITQKG